MNEYALIKGGVFVEVRRYAEKPDDIPHKSVVWLPVVRETINNATQKYTDEVVTEAIEPTRYLITTTISDKPQAEIDAYLGAQKDAQVERIEDATSIIKALAVALFEVVNDVRVLKGQQAITAAQFKTYIRSKL